MDLKSLSAAFLLLTLLACPCLASDALPLPAGAGYQPEEKETGFSGAKGIYLLPEKGPAEMLIDGVRLYPGEGRELAGDERVEIRPASDGIFKADIRYILVDQEGGTRISTLSCSFGECAWEGPEAEPCYLTPEKGKEIRGELKGSSPYGSVEYILLKPPGKGRVETKGAEFVYYPADGQTGSDRFYYAVRDKLGMLSKPACVRLFIGEEDTGVLQDARLMRTLFA